MNDAINQVRDLFLSMTPAARITTAPLAGVIGVSLAYLSQGFSGGADELLFNGEFLPPRQADRIQTAFAKKSLEGYRREGNRFYVPRGQQSAYLAAVAEDGALPANFDTLLEDSLVLSPFVSSEERAERIKAVREAKLSMLIRDMEGVEDARVMYDIRDSKGFGKRQITATVSLQSSGNESLNPQRVSMIRKAVASAIAGLDPNEVTILNLSDGSQFGGAGSVSAETFDDPYFKTRTKFEQLMKSNIEDLLSYIPGVRVQVTAELDEALEKTTTSLKNEGEGVAIRESKQTESVNSERTEDQARPGLSAQGPNRRSADEAVAKNKTTEENIVQDTESFVPTTELFLREAGLVPKSVRTAIAIPSDYLVRVWRETNPDAAPAATPNLNAIEGPLTDNIKGSVAMLLPREPGQTQIPNVEVTVFQSLTPAPLEPPSMGSTALVWASQNLQTLVMAGIALVGLMMLRSLIKATPPARASAALGTPALAVEGVGATSAGGAAGGGVGDGEAADGSERQRLKMKKGPTLRDDLTDIVREDPDAAAAILRSWIGNAA